MKYLVDANVLSEPTRPAPDARVVDWLRRHERDLAVNPIILGELEYGILILPAGRRRTRLEQWFTPPAGVTSRERLERELSQRVERISASHPRMDSRR